MLEAIKKNKKKIYEPNKEDKQRGAKNTKYEWGTAPCNRGGCMGNLPKTNKIIYTRRKTVNEEQRINNRPLSFNTRGGKESYRLSSLFTTTIFSKQIG